MAENPEVLNLNVPGTPPMPLKIDLMTCTMEEYEKCLGQGKEFQEAQAEWQAREWGALIYAMYIGTLDAHGNPTPRTYILLYRVTRMLKICREYMEGKRKHLPKEFW